MGLPLSYAEYGAGPPLMILHGMLGSSNNWRGIAKRLASAYHVFAVDLRNHGQSPKHESMSYAEMAEDVRDFIRQQNLQRVSLLGHSMGGKTAMMLALEHGSLVERLIVVDIAPVDYQTDHLDYVKVMQAIDLNEIKNRVQVDAAMRGRIPQTNIRMFLTRNLIQRDEHFDWCVNLSALALNMKQLAGFPEIAPGQVYEHETYFIHGALSHYVRSAHQGAIFGLFPNAKLIPIPNAAHWVHFDQPGRFVECVCACLEASTQSGGHDD
jgi:pimeloyl-ACP methyl ester carboxylesterase